MSDVVSQVEGAVNEAATAAVTLAEDKELHAALADLEAECKAAGSSLVTVLRRAAQDMGVLSR